MIAQIVEFVSNEGVATALGYSLIAAIGSFATIHALYLIIRNTRGRMGRRIEVQEGQRYEKVLNFPSRNKHFKVCAEPTVWEVQSVSAGHACLINPKDSWDTRLVSCSTLADDRYFKLQAEPDSSGGSGQGARDHVEHRAKAVAHGEQGADGGLNRRRSVLLMRYRRVP